MAEATRARGITGSGSGKRMCDLIADDDVKGLQEVRGQLNEKDDMNRSPLMQAAFRRRARVVAWLLTHATHTFDKGNRREDGRTPLMYVCALVGWWCAWGVMYYTPCLVFLGTLACQMPPCWRRTSMTHSVWSCC